MSKWQELRDKVSELSGVDFISVQKVFKALRQIAQDSGVGKVFAFIGHVMDIEDDE